MLNRLVLTLYLILQLCSFITLVFILFCRVCRYVVARLIEYMSLLVLVHTAFHICIECPARKHSLRSMFFLQPTNARSR